jgi:hypothetical protein
VAEAAVSLKQGAGRLIRRETDHGLLVICDPRLRQMGYGRRLHGGAAADGRADRRGRSAGLAGDAGRHARRAAATRICHHGFASASGAGTREVGAVGEVLAQHALGIVAQRHQLQLVVARTMMCSASSSRRRLLELGHRLLRAVGRGHVGAGG